jgi:adenosylcobinamide-GDP ribazoletransferase
MRFDGIARFAPFVGIGIGCIVTGVDVGLQAMGMPVVTRCGLVVLVWLVVTGGLHLDGAIDAADGLAVPDRTRRLAVMADSRTGAFGVMAAIVLLGLKTLCLIDLGTLRWFGVVAATGWGRWGQVVAIAQYPYLKAEGKGALHKQHAHPSTDWVWGFTVMMTVTGAVLWRYPAYGWYIAISTLGSVVATLLIGAWFNRQLGGHTGDTYGAIVEWTEVWVLLIAVGGQAIA